MITLCNISIGLCKKRANSLMSCVLARLMGAQKGRSKEMLRTNNDEVCKLTLLLVKLRLHPLIHTYLRFASAQNVEKRKAEPTAPHSLSLNQDVVGRSQEGE